MTAELQFHPSVVLNWASAAGLLVGSDRCFESFNVSVVKMCVKRPYYPTFDLVFKAVK